MNNMDVRVVEAFGEEWAHLDQSVVSPDQRISFERYFRIFPWSTLPQNAVGFDVGCGSGRWARFVAQRVGTLHCIDPSEAALEVAKRNLQECRNCRFHLAGVDNMPVEDGTMDFGYALGVLHHVPDPPAALKICVGKLRDGAPFLVYLYYAFDNRPFWYRWIWRGSDLLRRTISRMPFGPRYWISQAIAGTVYYPLARLSLLLERFGMNVENIPLSDYRAKPFYSMRTDALDRFGTRLEHRFSATQIVQMMEQADLSDVVVSDSPPYWCALDYRR